MKKIIVTAISAIAVIASVIGCQIYDSQTNQTLASAMNRDQQKIFKLQDYNKEFNDACAALIDNSSDVNAYNKIVDMYMGYDKFRTAATAYVSSRIDKPSNTEPQEDKNAHKHDYSYILNDYKSNYFTAEFLYNSYYKSISDKYDRMPVDNNYKKNEKPEEVTEPKEPAKYTDPDTSKKNNKKPTEPDIGVTADLSDDTANDAAYAAYKAELAEYRVLMDKYKRSKEYATYLKNLNKYETKDYPKYLSDLQKYEDARVVYIDEYAEFEVLSVVANPNSPDDTVFSIADMYQDVNKLNWDYNSKK